MNEKEVLEAFPRKTFKAFGKTLAGDVFYSDIYLYLTNKVGKKKVGLYYSKVVDILCRNNYWVHS
jgi:hypothetical protein